jgi:hypothetical protein
MASKKLPLPDDALLLPLLDDNGAAAIRDWTLRGMLLMVEGSCGFNEAADPEAA